MFDMDRFSLNKQNYGNITEEYQVKISNGREFL